MNLKHSFIDYISDRVRNILIYLLISSLFFCVTCSSYVKLEKTGYSFCALSSTFAESSDCFACSASSAKASYHTTTPIQTIGAAFSFHFDLASEETLGRLSPSHSTISMLSRGMTNQQRGLALFQLIILISTLLSGSLNRLRSSAYENHDRYKDNSLCIARYIELSDGKK